MDGVYIATIGISHGKDMAFMSGSESMHCIFGYRKALDRVAHIKKYCVYYFE